MPRRGADAVVHLIALIAGRPEEFERVMSQGTRDLVAAAREAGVSRFVLMSALGTTEESKDLVPYYRSKWDMEQAVKTSGIEHVIFRPSFVFGRDGGILPTFMRQVRYSPITPVPGSGTRRLQPIWVEDVAAFFARSLSSEEAANKTFDLGGPDRVTWNELYDRIKRTLGKRRATLHVPMGLMRAGAALAEKLPRPLVTRDQLTSSSTRTTSETSIRRSGPSASTRLASTSSSVEQRPASPGVKMRGPKAPHRKLAWIS